MCFEEEVLCQAVLEGLCEVRRDCVSVYRRALSISGQSAEGTKLMKYVL